MCMKVNVSILTSWLLILICLYFLYQLISVPNGWIFLDNVNLLIHEAGHLIFLPFGQFIQILGGSLFQIIFPFSFLFYFLFKKEYFSVSFILFWIGNNFINVSIYMKDAIIMQLPLLGGDRVIHDWNFLFTKMGILNQAQIIANMFWYLGFAFIGVSLIGMITFTISKMRSV